MDPATIIGGVSSLVGALAGKNRAARPSDTWRHTVMGVEGQAAGARAAAEKYGFNPMALLGVSSPLQAQAVDNSQFGALIANAGLAVADGINAASERQAYQEQLEAQNKELRTALDAATLRPKVAGIYSGQPGIRAGVADPLTLQVGEIPIEHKWIKIWDSQSERFTWYPNPDLMDAGPTEMGTGIATISAAELGQHGSPGGFEMMFKPPAGLSFGKPDPVPEPWVSFKKPGSDDPSIPRIGIMDPPTGALKWQ